MTNISRVGKFDPGAAVVAALPAPISGVVVRFRESRIWLWSGECYFFSART